MAYLNTYKPPAPLPEDSYHLSTPLDSYDLNFSLLSIPPLLETPGGVRLYPLIPSIHARRLFQLNIPFPSSYKYLPYGPFPSLSSFLTFLEDLRRDDGVLLFVVYDMSLEFTGGPKEELEREGGAGLREERIAGIVGVLKSVPKNRTTEIGHLHISPPFQRSHVLSHSITLLQHWTLDAPSSSSPHSLGLRRLQWFSNSLNVPSITAAKRLGFELESDCLRWERITKPEKEGLELPAFLEGERKELEEEVGGGRHSAVLSIGWDRWEEGTREMVDKMIEDRPVQRRKVETIEFGVEKERN